MQTHANTRKYIFTLNVLNASNYKHNQIVKTSKPKHMQEQDCLKAARHASAHFGDHVENKSFAYEEISSPLMFAIYALLVFCFLKDIAMDTRRPIAWIVYKQTYCERVGIQ